MQKSVEFRGKTPDDALANGLRQLGLERDDVSVEILERGKKGVFGIGASDAVLRITYEVPDPVPPKPAEEPVAKPAPKAPEKAAPKPAEKPAPGPAEKPAEKPAPRQSAPKPANPAPAAAPAKQQAPKKPSAQPKKPAEPKPARPEEAAPSPTPEKKAEPKPARRSKPEGSQAERTQAFLSGLLEHMDVKAEMSITPREGGGLNVQLSGADVGAIIGRRGETLDAIQHLTNYVVNRGGERKERITVDAENYRAKREESLVRLAEKMAAKAVKYKRSMALEPMNSYERHVIHTALQNYEGVSTSSIGTEPNRRVVVSYVPSEPVKKESQDYKEWC